FAKVRAQGDLGHEQGRDRAGQESSSPGMENAEGETAFGVLHCLFVVREAASQGCIPAFTPTFAGSLPPAPPWVPAWPCASGSRGAGPSAVPWTAASAPAVPWTAAGWAGVGTAVPTTGASASAAPSAAPASAPAAAPVSTRLTTFFAARFR